MNMISKFQNATDKALIFWQNKVRCSGYFKQRIHMAKTSPPAVQRLYENCKNTLTSSGPPPSSPQAVHKLCSLLDTFGPSDVGLKEESPDDDRGHGCFGCGQLDVVAQWAQPITYLDIYECNSFTICIFCLPTSSVIPLHNHPGMTVFSKVLYGSLHVKAYDWVEPPCIQQSRPGHPPVRLAKLAADKVMTARSATSVLYPKTGGNLHCFTAVTPCAVLDVLTPPYREDMGRTCSYYVDHPFSRFGAGTQISNGQEEEYAWLAEIEPPDVNMRPGKYAGPPIEVRY